MYRESIQYIEAEKTNDEIMEEFVVSNPDNIVDEVPFYNDENLCCHPSFLFLQPKNPLWLAEENLHPLWFKSDFEQQNQHSVVVRQ